MNKETKPQEVSFFGKLWQKILALFSNFKKNSKPEITVDLINLNNSSPSINQTETNEIKYLTHQTEPSLEHLKSSNKLSFAQNLNKDLLLLGIAIGCVLGVIYFIFGGLQPVLLKGYIKNTIQSIATVNQTFINQTNSLILFNTNLLNATTYNLLADCSPEQKYQTLTQDLEKLENLERALLPNQQLQEPSKFNGFKDREVYLRYQQYYEFYKQNLQNLKESVLEDSRDFLLFANHRNHFIDGCVLLIQANSLNQEIINFCTEIPKKNQEYKNNHQPSFWPSLEPLLKENNDLCNQLIENPKNFLKNKLSWLSSFGKIVGFLPEIDKNTDLINQAVEAMKTESTRINQDLHDIYSRKTSFLGMWYLLEF